MIPQDLLAILRCPHCAAIETRHPGDDPGRLTLVKNTWLVCEEPDCRRKYPINDDIPDMRVEVGYLWTTTDVAELPVPPPVRK